MNIDQAAARLGIPTRELAEVLDTPAGTVYVHADGSRLIDVPGDVPDAEGKAGLMFFTLPHARYKGVFPVYAPPLDDEDGDWTEVTAAAGTTEVAKPRRGRPPKAKE